LHKNSRIKANNDLISASLGKSHGRQHIKNLIKADSINETMPFTDSSLPFRLTGKNRALRPLIPVMIKNLQ
uniref:hypothetical protein n=1 Tax=Dialister succinatiphilus TaxID=487173 RepID=UPI00402708B6